MAHNDPRRVGFRYLSTAGVVERALHILDGEELDTADQGEGKREVRPSARRRPHLGSVHAVEPGSAQGARAAAQAAVG
jgi:hypothetical protein